MLAWAVLVVAGTGALVLGIQGSDHALPPPAPSIAAQQAVVTATPSATVLSTRRSIPLTLSIPAIKIAVPVGALGLGAYGTVEVPTGTQQPGWFDKGPTPGQIGSAVLLGHVDSYLGPGVFFNLRTLAPGDQVDVGLSDGVTVQFTVNEVVQYSKQQFPSQSVYGSHGSSELQLVTCGGVFDHQTGSYLSNIVVYTTLSTVVPPAGSNLHLRSP